MIVLAFKRDKCNILFFLFLSAISVTLKTKWTSASGIPVLQMKIAFSTNNSQQVILSQYNPIDLDVLPSNFSANPCIFKGPFEGAPDSRVAVTNCCPQEDCLNFEVKVTSFVSEVKQVVP